MIYHYTLTGSCEGGYFEYWFWSRGDYSESEWERIVIAAAVDCQQYDDAIYLTEVFNTNRFKNEMERKGFFLVTVQAGFHLTGSCTPVHQALNLERRGA